MGFSANTNALRRRPSGRGAYLVADGTWPPDRGQVGACLASPESRFERRRKRLPQDLGVGEVQVAPDSVQKLSACQRTTRGRLVRRHGSAPPSANHPGEGPLASLILNRGTDRARRLISHPEPVARAMGVPTRFQQRMRHRRNRSAERQHHQGCFEIRHSGPRWRSRQYRRAQLSGMKGGWHPHQKGGPGGSLSATAARRWPGASRVAIFGLCLAKAVFRYHIEPIEIWPDNRAVLP